MWSTDIHYIHTWFDDPAGNDWFCGACVDLRSANCKHAWLRFRKKSAAPELVSFKLPGACSCMIMHFHMLTGASIWKCWVLMFLFQKETLRKVMYTVVHLEPLVRSKSLLVSPRVNMCRITFAGWRTNDFHRSLDRGTWIYHKSFARTIYVLFNRGSGTNSLTQIWCKYG